MNALGMIETVGMVAAVTAGDSAVKSANVKLIGYEITKGGGMVTIKFIGNVAAVKAALESASIEAEKVNRVISKHFIPRPHDDLEKLIQNNETIGAVNISSADSGLTDTVKESYQVDKKESSIEDRNPNISKQFQEEQKEFSTAKIDEKEVCNICKDPECTRRKGELRLTCKHYNNEKSRRNVP